MSKPNSQSIPCDHSEATKQIQSVLRNLLQPERYEVDYSGIEYRIMSHAADIYEKACIGFTPTKGEMWPERYDLRVIREAGGTGEWVRRIGGWAIEEDANPDLQYRAVPGNVEQVMLDAIYGSDAK